MGAAVERSTRRSFISVVSVVRMAQTLNLPTILEGLIVNLKIKGRNGRFEINLEFYFLIRLRFTFKPS